MKVKQSDNKINEDPSDDIKEYLKNEKHFWKKVWKTEQM